MTREYRTFDKSGWKRGPWDDEPDKVQWCDPCTRLPCLIVRNPSGALCGYVGVTDRHPWHGKQYSEPIAACTEECGGWGHIGHLIGTRINVHGGLTFSGACQHGGDESQYICHVPDPGEPDNVWWFGFDCAHCGDVNPKFLNMSIPFMEAGTYRDMAYVREQVTALAQQLAAVTT